MQQDDIDNKSVRSACVLSFRGKYNSSNTISIIFSNPYDSSFEAKGELKLNNKSIKLKSEVFIPFCQKHYRSEGGKRHFI